MYWEAPPLLYFEESAIGQLSWLHLRQIKFYAKNNAFISSVCFVLVKHKMNCYRSSTIDNLHLIRDLNRRFKYRQRKNYADFNDATFNENKAVKKIKITLKYGQLTILFRSLVITLITIQVSGSQQVGVKLLKHGN